MSDEGRWIDIVFDELPGPDGCRFIEVEDEQRRGMAFGEWVVRDDGYACLRIPDPAALVEVARTIARRYLHFPGCLIHAEEIGRCTCEMPALRTALNPEERDTSSECDENNEAMSAFGEAIRGREER